MSIFRATRRQGKLRRLAGVLTVLVVLTSWWVWFRPVALGGTTTLVTVSGKSMEPGMRTGDLAWVRQTDDYAVGDVVAYRVPNEGGGKGPVVIHRIVEIDPTGKFVFQGDNNDFRDPWQLRPEQITGELWLHVPNAGAVFSELRKPATAGAAMAALVMFLVLSGGRDEKKDERRDDAAPVSTGGTS